MFSGTTASGAERGRAVSQKPGTEQRGPAREDSGRGCAARARRADRAGTRRGAGRGNRKFRGDRDAVACGGARTGRLDSGLAATGTAGRVNPPWQPAVGGRAAARRLARLDRCWRRRRRFSGRAGSAALAAAMTTAARCARLPRGAADAAVQVAVRYDGAAPDGQGRKETGRREARQAGRSPKTRKRRDGKDPARFRRRRAVGVGGACRCWRESARQSTKCRYLVLCTQRRYGACTKHPAPNYQAPLAVLCTKRQAPKNQAPLVASPPLPTEGRASPAGKVFGGS